MKEENRRRRSVTQHFVADRERTMYAQYVFEGSESNDDAGIFYLWYSYLQLYPIIHNYARMDVGFG